MRSLFNVLYVVASNTKIMTKVNVLVNTSVNSFKNINIKLKTKLKMVSGYHVFFEMFREYNMLNFKMKIVIKCHTFLLVNQQTSKFTHSSDIPVEFIRKNVKLRGRLCRITENGLEIEHIPITLPVISSWRSK